MAHSKNTLIASLLLCITTLYIPLNADLTSLAKNDAYPVFSTLNIDDAFLLTAEQLKYKDVDWADRKKSRVSISVTPFGQNADRGKTIKGQLIPSTLTNGVLTETALGDLTGNTSMLALLYGKFPAGVTTYPGINGGALSDAQNALFCCLEPGTIDYEPAIDPAQLFGYFSFPLTYRKRGVRFELAARFYKDFGLRIQAGVSSIRQVREDTINLTPDTYPGCQPCTPLTQNGCNPEIAVEINKENVNCLLMNKLDVIAQEIGLNIGNFIETSSEELRFNLFWRHAFELNKDEENDSWSHFLMIPYAEISASLSPGATANSNQLFSVPFGNNGHTSYGFTTGVNFDFIETIEIGGEVGFTAFAKKSFCDYRVPNSKFQTNIFPFTTDVTIRPGHNWHFGARIAAYHFLENLSMYFEWFVVDHKQDSITLDKPDPKGAFLPCYLAQTTSFKTKLGNAGFNYDISPNIGLGFLWQIPFSQRNSYRSSTIMAGLNITF